MLDRIKRWLGRDAAERGERAELVQSGRAGADPAGEQAAETRGDFGDLDPGLGIGLTGTAGFGSEITGDEPDELGEDTYADLGAATAEDRAGGERRPDDDRR